MHLSIAILAVITGAGATPRSHVKSTFSPSPIPSARSLFLTLLLSFTAFFNASISDEELLEFLLSDFAGAAASKNHITCLISCIWGTHSRLINELVIRLCIVLIEWLCPQSILGATCLPLNKMPYKPSPCPPFFFHITGLCAYRESRKLLLWLKPCNNIASEEERKYSTAMVFPHLTTPEVM